MKQKEKSMTIAGFISLLGMVLLSVFTYLGLSFLNPGELGMNVLKSLGLVVVLATVLNLLLRAKRAENDLKKWLVAEIVLLVVYIVIAICTFSGVSHFFTIQSQREELKRMAWHDYQLYMDVYDNYEKISKKMIADTKTELESSLTDGMNVSKDVVDWRSDNGIYSKAAVKGWESNVNELLMGTKWEKLKSEFEQRKESNMEIVENWSIIQLPYVVEALVDDTVFVAELNAMLDKSKDKLPIIEYDTYTEEYVCAGVNTAKVSLDVSKLQFADALSKTDSPSFLAIVVFILVHLLILFRYFMAYRTAVVRNKYMVEDGGHILNV